jgi:MoxR-like ATPase
MIDEVRAALAVAIQVGQPVLLWGAPGEGKTSLIEAVGGTLRRPVEVVIGSLREASDFAGIPMRTDDGVCFAPPSWALRCLAAPDSIIFFDELTTADVTVQAAMMRVIHERICGDLALPSTVSIVAAANPPDTAVGGSDLAAPLANRFLHLDFEATVDEWVEGMLEGWSTGELPLVEKSRATEEARWRSTLVSFIRHRPELLRRLPARSDQQGRAWPSPRTWDRAAGVAAAAASADTSAKVLMLLVSGLVGEGAGMEFLQFVRKCDLQDPEALLRSPELFDPTRRTDFVITALKGVSDAVAANCTKARWDAAWVLVEATCDVENLDVAAMTAMDLMRCRSEEWAVPRTIRYFNELFQESRIG